MTFRTKTTTALCLSALALSACGGGTASGIPSLFVGDAPITEADYIGKTFPVRYVGRNIDGTLYRGVATLRYIAADEVELKIEGIEDTLIEGFPGEYIGATLFAETFAESPELISAFADDDATVEFYGFLGFETTTAGLPTEDLFFYDSTASSIIILSDGLETITDLGDTVLDINFSTGDVSGSLHSSEFIDVSLVGASFSGNGITGGVEFTSFTEELPIITETINGQASGTFFGPDATALAGTYEGTAVADSGPDIDFVGGFLGFKELPDL